MKKRDLFAELMKGIEEMTAHREGRFESRSNVSDDSLDSQVTGRMDKSDYLERTDDEVP
jgi:hypothetical protein